MTVSTIPQNGGNSQPNAKNSAEISGRPLTEAELIQAEVDRYVTKTMALQNDLDLNSGQTDLVAYARFSCKTFGYCGKDKFVANFVASRKNKRHIAADTARRYLRHVIAEGFVLQATDVRGKTILIADASPARMEQVYRAKTAEIAEAEASARRVAQAVQERQEQERQAFRDLAHLAAEAAENIPEEPENSTPPAENSTSSAENIPEGVQDNDDRAGKFCSEDGKIFPPVQMGDGGGISPGISVESVGETTTTPNPAGEAGVEESRAREDAAGGPVVAVFDAGALEEEEGEGWDQHEAGDEDEDDSIMEDPFADDWDDEEPISMASHAPGRSSLDRYGDTPAAAPTPVYKAVQEALGAAGRPVMTAGRPVLTAGRPVLTEDQRTASDWLLEHGVSRADAQRFVLEDLALVKRHIEWFPHQTVKANAGGYLFKALTEGWGAPTGYLAAQKVKAEAEASAGRRAARVAEAEARAVRAEALTAQVAEFTAALQQDDPDAWMTILDDAEKKVPMEARRRPVGEAMRKAAVAQAVRLCMGLGALL